MSKGWYAKGYIYLIAELALVIFCPSVAIKCISSFVAGIVALTLFKVHMEGRY